VIDAIQLKYDRDLVDALRRYAVRLEPRSGKAALLLRTAADRLAAHIANSDRPSIPPPSGGDD
jgi:hypothetical protein